MVVSDKLHKFCIYILSYAHISIFFVEYRTDAAERDFVKLPCDASSPALLLRSRESARLSPGKLALACPISDIALARRALLL